MTNSSKLKPNNSKKWQRRLYDIIFEADTRAGKTFDVLLLISILVSTLAVLLESVKELEIKYGAFFRTIEWLVTILFSIEYLARVLAVKNPHKYIFSFWGIIDFLAVIPTYIGLLFTGTHQLVIIRIVRLLRVFRILKLGQHLKEAEVIITALKASSYKITVFLGSVVALVTVNGTLMYMIEGPENGFTSIPISIYWAIVTLTTVGFGDIVPITTAGKLLASITMITGYAIIAVPTGIVTTELVNANKKSKKKTLTCKHCRKRKHEAKAIFCSKCGYKL
jgi:voltage-gated potassium channel